jgi:hypothetical protein
MKNFRRTALVAVAAAATLLSGCVIAPLGHYRHGGGYHGGPRVVEQPPVVVVPAPPHRPGRGGYYR